MHLVWEMKCVFFSLVFKKGDTTCFRKEVKMDVVKREGTIIRSIWSTREGWKWGEMLTLDQCEEGTEEAECAM